MGSAQPFVSGRTCWHIYTGDYPCICKEGFGLPCEQSLHVEPCTCKVGWGNRRQGDTTCPLGWRSALKQPCQKVYRYKRIYLPFIMILSDLSDKLAPLVEWKLSSARCSFLCFTRASERVDYGWLWLTLKLFLGRLFALLYSSLLNSQTAY